MSPRTEHGCSASTVSKARERAEPGKHELVSECMYASIQANARMWRVRLGLAKRLSNNRHAARTSTVVLPWIVCVRPTVKKPRVPC